jgi:hypothetical protein
MLFQPQRAQKQPHPVVVAFVKAAAAFAARERTL